MTQPDLTGLASHLTRPSINIGHNPRTYEPMSMEECLDDGTELSRPWGHTSPKPSGFPAVWDHDPITQEESNEADEKIAIKVEEDEDYAQHNPLFQTSPRCGSPVQRRVAYAVPLDTMYPALSRDRLVHRARSLTEDRMVSAYHTHYPYTAVSCLPLVLINLFSSLSHFDLSPQRIYKPMYLSQCKLMDDKNNW
ncbi:hypothetical protein PIIN_08344 [Serendipita indica DSM 11827]|uniref:Uncharacterized protein n=1 Tax=Serendipita indica (strain DSM 11827) TaxID=1109443 RepID=G4TSU5_SERID|nr:hypothetical protein PIIN_08344 [Serendipita indica DSM 11827]